MKMRYMYKILAGKPEEKLPLGHLNVDGRIILNRVRNCELDSSGPG
jgi:hypothetical protein